MGSGGSKPEQHIFNADAPVRFSQSVLDSLQRNPESDSTRAQTNELKLQSRVNAELTRIRDSQAQKLEDLTARLTINPEEPSSDTPTPPSGPTGFFGHLASPFYQDHTSIKDLIHGLSSNDKKDSGRSHDSVHMEITELRQKLEARKKADRSSPEVEKAKESLVQCLRVNDRRPLDCWREVEEFKREVGRLERAFVERVGR
ncbi:DUF1690-domain-containing protein [Teratosphaeria nubilosa]|uniref:DUF1690-domain-containing protein n=1 Tax=Teratosphaeria nubilosa TaxID=161662 RepID=A0A6G1LCT6_9PEZI|nr:DUF1690-domain-containing protein [Teratosphaeria nubilosa]